MAIVASRAGIVAGRAAEAPASTPWLRPALAAAVAVAIVAAAAVITGKLGDPGVLPIKTVRVEGRFDHVEEAQLQQVIAARIRGNFFNANVDEVRLAVQELPWVRSASVHRLWPGTLKITVVEQQPLARWHGGSGLVNQYGEVFTPEGAGPDGLPVFRGPDGASAAVSAAYREMVPTLAPLGLTITAVALNARRAWQVTLDNGIELVLGRKDRMLRLRRFARVYPGALAGTADEIAQVDLRYTNGFAVRWKTDTRAGAKQVLKTRVVA